MCSAESMLRALQARTLAHCEDTWSIRPSGLGGRGMFAYRDLLPGDTICHVHPILAGPRAKPDLMCASCHRQVSVTHCPQGCHLPICSPECSTSSQHVRECQVLRDSVDLPATTWRLDLVGTVIPLRALSLGPDDREVIQCLQGNEGKIHGQEVDLLKQHMKDKLNEEDEQWMRQCCISMDTNAFEFIKVFEDGSQTSLRGLYPLAAMFNHACSPNTCHIYDKDGVMKVFAAREIKAGEEMTTSYSALLWSTPFRQINLAHTKHFRCRCDRCADPTEFGSMLSGLPCTQSGCTGLLLPGSPLKPHSPWFCATCSHQVSVKEATQLQVKIGAVLQKYGSVDPRVVAGYLCNPSLPSQTQTIVQLKLNLVWQLGHDKTLTWSELTQALLDMKEKCCRDVLHVLDQLRFGCCRMKGLVLLELHGALCEQIRRSTTDQTLEKTRVELLTLLQSAQLILQEDAAAKRILDQAVQEQLSLNTS